MPSSDADQTSTISFLISNKKTRLLVIDGYIYQQNKSTAKVSYWLCEIELCNAGVYLNSDDQFLKYAENPHTHIPRSNLSPCSFYNSNIHDNQQHSSTTEHGTYSCNKPKIIKKSTSTCARKYVSASKKQPET
ncbi:unnamed protein product [Rotaria socialis]|uniref:FLYWCH-type domain-containing protein n=1 Tax=Rotaria socialis TaxID=392032 RepID=A0A818IJB8_9BILA|nr:unnamed protein product [Rotaria socialis]